MGDEQRISADELITRAREQFESATDFTVAVEEELAASGPGRAVLDEALDTLVTLMNPFTPHVCEEMWRKRGHTTSLVDQPWPAADPALLVEDAVELAVQVNGKVRAKIVVPQGAAEADVRQRALDEPRIKEHVSGKEVVKLVVVPGRLVSLVVR